MIDAHQHFWSIGRGDYGWLTPDKGPIYRDFGPGDLKPVLDRYGIDRTILVQAAPTVAETRSLLAIAAATPWVAGVVGWVDFEAADAPEQIAALANDRLLVGLRPMVQDIADDDWMIKPALVPAFEAMERHGLVFDALVLPRHLPRLLEVVRRHRGLNVVVDHLAKPFVARGVLDPWRADMAAIAAEPNAVCKMSGLITEAAAGWTVADLRPYVAHILTVFGADRVLWGSDWPVAILGGGYERWREATAELLAVVPDAARAAILGGAAERVYLTGRGRR